jgi:hypothetical protein
MQALKFGLITALLIFVAGAQASFGQAAGEEGWRRVDAEGRLAFYLPPAMKQRDVHGIENLYQEYSDGRLTLSFVYEPMSVLAYTARESEFGKDYREIATEIDGQKALLFIYHRDTAAVRTYHADIYVGDLPKGRVRLWMWARSTNRDDMETAQRIFSSVEFKDKRPPD